MSREQQSDRLPDEPSLSALYRNTRKEQPSPELDQAVMQEARRALDRRRKRWWLPLSTAAVILLGVSLTLNQMGPPEFSEPSVISPAESLDEGLPPASAPMPQLQGLGEKAQQSEQSPRLKRAAPARSESPLERRLLDAPVQLESEEASEVKADLAIQGETPEAQVAQLLELLRRGDIQGLQEALRLFRQAHPEHPLPEELEAFEAPVR